LQTSTVLPFVVDALMSEFGGHNMNTLSVLSVSSKKLGSQTQALADTDPAGDVDKDRHLLH